MRRRPLHVLRARQQRRLGLVRPKPHISEARQLGVVFGAVEHELPPQRRRFAEERARVVEFAGVVRDHALE